MVIKMDGFLLSYPVFLLVGISIYKPKAHLKYGTYLTFFFLFYQVSIQIIYDQKKMMMKGNGYSKTQKDVSKDFFFMYVTMIL